MPAGGFPLGNVLLYLAAVAAPVAGFWLLPKLARLLGRAGRRGRRPTEPDLPPIERLAADLRRVHRSLRTLHSGAPALRRRATSQAYDALLVQACRAVEVPHRLDGELDGVEREAERLRVEEELRRAGLAIP
ncbi:hypothetical protein [Amycolatopsis cihanbeyliensis]|uniref:Uncharacterized protein n=1 Tax=Amycolatopsis cihanbeyliensis TaxID=1128664 RepID=A0A542DL43_AMYCI|nr:hypothetical protein [Amycolatopsis cihanbeyliensis]TQJ03822.1 hypothetical protein FB471_3590 [Amycolatopsis cihanbeyliensis]